MHSNLALRTTARRCAVVVLPLVMALIGWTVLRLADPIPEWNRASVGGRKMYEFKKGMWETYDAKLERRAENTQLYQVIRIAGDTLRFRAHTATGGLYDAFDLVRRSGKPNRFRELMKGTEATRTFADGPPYTW